MEPELNFLPFHKGAPLVVFLSGAQVDSFLLILLILPPGFRVWE